LLQGSIRENIDPFYKFSDEVIWEELRSVRLEEYVKGLPDGIKTKVNDNLFSVGQK
jgi:ABC-type multidrug transport system fused ATPase/permease subunit